MSARVIFRRSKDPVPDNTVAGEREYKTFAPAKSAKIFEHLARTAVGGRLQNNPTV
jgi:hypothetical protein